MSREADASDDEFKTAVAAAAYAVHTLEEFSPDNQRKQMSGNGKVPPLTKSKSRKDDKQTPSKTLSRLFTGQGEVPYNSIIFGTIH